MKLKEDCQGARGINLDLSLAKQVKINVIQLCGQKEKEKKERKSSHLQQHA